MNEGLETSWQKFFNSGFYHEGWHIEITQERTQKEVDGVLALLKPEPGSKGLDWCCGEGRHVVELAKRGFSMTGLDFSATQLGFARELSTLVGVNVDIVHADFRATPPEIQADFAVNMFTAGIGYLTEEDDVTALKSLHAALKPNARFLLDTMNLFWLVRNYLPRGWHESEDKFLRVIDKREFHILENRNHSETTYIRRDGTEEVQTLDHRIYTPYELKSVLLRAGFRPVEWYGDFDGSVLTFDSRRMIVICEK